MRDVRREKHRPVEGNHANVDAYHSITLMEDKARDSLIVNSKNRIII